MKRQAKAASETGVPEERARRRGTRPSPKWILRSRAVAFEELSRRPIGVNSIVTMGSAIRVRNRFSLTRRSIAH